jgi:hypothetical protein
MKLKVAMFFLTHYVNVGRLFVYQVALYANWCLFVLACSLESQCGGRRRVATTGSTEAWHVGET